MTTRFMREILPGSLICILLVVIAWRLTDLWSDPPRRITMARVVQNQEGVVTLYAHDRLRWSFSPMQGGYGLVVLDGKLYNKRSILRYDGEYLSMPAQGGTEASFKDLGELREDGFSLYHSIILDGDRLGWHKSGYESGLQRGAAFLQLPKPDSGTISLPVRPGHTLIAHVNHNSQKQSFFLKMLVVAHHEGQSVEIRYEAFPIEVPAPR
jgi:hypothetical protein